MTACAFATLPRRRRCFRLPDRSACDERESRRIPARVGFVALRHKRDWRRRQHHHGRRRRFPDARPRPHRRRRPRTLSRPGANCGRHKFESHQLQRGRLTSQRDARHRRRRRARTTSWQARATFPHADGDATARLYAADSFAHSTKTRAPSRHITHRDRPPVPLSLLPHPPNSDASKRHARLSLTTARPPFILSANAPCARATRSHGASLAHRRRKLRLHRLYQGTGRRRVYDALRARALSVGTLARFRLARTT